MTMSEVRHRTIFGRLYHGETDIDFIGRWKLWFLISGVIILIGLVSLFARGLNLGIDFKGGTVWEVDAGDVSVAEARGAVNGAGGDGPQGPRLPREGGGRPRGAARPVGDAAERQQIEQQISDALREITGSEQVDVN